MSPSLCGLSDRSMAETPPQWRIHQHRSQVSTFIFLLIFFFGKSCSCLQHNSACALVPRTDSLSLGRVVVPMRLCPASLLSCTVSSDSRFSCLCVSFPPTLAAPTDVGILDVLYLAGSDTGPVLSHHWPHHLNVFHL